jgi:hypothetical protein
MPFLIVTYLLCLHSFSGAQVSAEHIYACSMIYPFQYAHLINVRLKMEKAPSPSVSL